MDEARRKHSVASKPSGLYRLRYCLHHLHFQGYARNPHAVPPVFTKTGNSHLSPGGRAVQAKLGGLTNLHHSGD
ncbi:MAG TPA: hypothetical protein [Caudoviricetes sp.]|nr:MAG TPA: hypothetical protein [Caudoviricetes sp.]